MGRREDADDVEIDLPKRETDLFDALRDGGAYDNFMLIEVNGRPVICIDRSEDQDGSEIEPVYGRLSDIEAARVIEALEGVEEERRPRSKADRRFRG